MVERIAHYFNRRYRGARRDVYLNRTEAGWQVIGRIGGDGGDEAVFHYDDEQSARGMVDRMLKTASPGEDDWALMPQRPAH
ncbi:hypothetical protein JIG36_48795 [Actinoplanes sp. LDG1-06]|uniref:Uncharacterized protein n=1 Tax=Paractinoplanes ovalisporus TaxID=2810368 RepID=A0ABS2AW33_9ACTN|nr:hypothetical protein [Actinoplanes ovalisporus]MBM2623421.1 hypothetical protein [Actinoplanes ovalisporus]